jgi:hypothetical protein
MALKVKGATASRHQLEMGKLIVTMTKSRGGDAESCAGAIATAIQESGLSNINHGDRDSLGLYQQRTSMGWGSPTQIRTPSYAINKFLDQFLSYRKKGYGWLQASHKTQRSAHPSAPARWYSEGRAFTAAFIGSGSTAIDVGAGGEGGTEGFSYKVTREEPYEFSRGSADKEESTWECSGRLADEVQWRRFMRGGSLWYVSEPWLARQPPVVRLNEFTPGVISFGFEFETRTDPAEAQLKVAARRYSFLPGDAIEVYDEGPGSGRWLVSSVRRNLHQQVSDVTLVRRRPSLPEPAPQTRTETITVAGSPQPTSGAGIVNQDPAATTIGAKVFQAAQAASALRWSYSQPRRNSNGQNGYADCSSGVTWVLRKAGVPTPPSYAGNAPVSGTYMGWGSPGRGKQATVWANGGHIWIQFHGFPKWRFDTGGGSGGTLWAAARGTSGFVARHWGEM